VAKRRRFVRATLVSLILVGLLLVLAWTFRTQLLALIPTPPVVIDQNSDGQVVTMLQGERLEIRLPLNRYDNERWELGIPLSYMQQVGDVTFTQSSAPSRPGDGYQSTTFLATGTGQGPLFMDLVSDSNQQTLAPIKSFRVVVTVR
jgi:hypothetical protein